MYKQLTSEQRYTISVLLQNRTKQKEIAKAINVSPSTVSREIRRNSGVRGRYNWETAQANAVQTKRKKPGNHSIDKEVMEEARHLLVTEQWSPEQISGVLAKDGKYISHETIYRMIRKDKAEGGTLYKHCRHKLKRRARPVGSRRISIPNRTSISERPAEVDGKRFGDFEMDTIVGRGNHGAIVTLIERSTNMLFMRKLKKGKNAKELARTVIHLLSPFKEHVKSITTDNGTEFACHEMIGKSLGVTIYFADPYASWQKGAIENANGLIRQYVPKTETFEHVSHQQITKYSKKINIRPRKKLEFKTPHECFYEQIK
ncbi:IS30 family transposase [Prevotella nigrescens]|uniref:IS30 family transposase n=2 Tax=Prevotella nigrescens TaxID=28133 RepID=UPI001BAE035E|nr:IS30 family transposase [Prevotella nigrescens]QUB48556.1 IS30 family transposase [Prevotella nigrescens]QUB48715.1 IS30 family transposase [Prevotella nigrescens]QUB48906.1 IS30 family transposase [Prevotella nigrescens]QUB48925.1 IS30 family transposase [Prevotella nigrescens]QUB49091.1 IS30 family transposase [Prevotella nigrescens]